MKIAFDAQLLFEKQKTGIGWTTDYIVRNLIHEYDNEYYLNYFSIRNNREKDELIQKYNESGCKVNKCNWFHNAIYKRTWNNIPIPYSLFFRNKVEITQFFNYDIPPGVKGKAVTFVYDMVYKAFPETVSRKTMQMLDYNLAKTCERADHIITISEFSKSEIMRYMNISSDKISVMPCGVDLSKYHPNYSIDRIEGIKKKYTINDSEYILYLGTLEPRKNIERLVEAYAQLKKNISDPPKLVLAGKKGWMYDEIFKKVELYQLKNDVIFTDYIDDKDVALLLKGALIFVFPSIYEGFGLPPLEAMACGTPVIVSNQASLPEVVGDAGYLIDPYSINELANAMKELVTNDILRMQISKKGLLHAKSYSWKASAEQLMKIYRKLIR